MYLFSISDFLSLSHIFIQCILVFCLPKYFNTNLRYKPYQFTNHVNSVTWLDTMDNNLWKYPPPFPPSPALLFPSTHIVQGSPGTIEYWPPPPHKNPSPPSPHDPPPHFNPPPTRMSNVVLALVCLYSQHGFHPWRIGTEAWSFSFLQGRQVKSFSFLQGRPLKSFSFLQGRPVRLLFPPGASGKASLSSRGVR